MNEIKLNIRDRRSCDVLVVGGGVSGIAAAVCAARCGMSVILAEKNCFLGGAATAGLIGTFMTCCDAKGEEQIIKGFYGELLDRLISEGSAVSPEKCKVGNSYSAYRIKGHKGVAPYSCEGLKKTAEEMCLEAGVQLMYNSVLIACETAERQVKSAFFATDSGVFEISARYFIDCGGDAVLCQLAGCETVFGDKDGSVQPASMIFTIDGVDKELLDAYMKDTPEMRKRFFMDEIERGFADGSFPCGTKKLRIFEAPNGTWHVNMAQTDNAFNSLDPFETAAAAAEQRQQVGKIMDFLRKTIPALKNIRLLETASSIGIREGRRIVGEYTLTIDDLKNSVIFDDAILLCSNSVDMHQKSGVAYSTIDCEKNYSVPYRCLLTKEFDNLAAAGRCVSADRAALAAIRVMPPCFAMGEAVGTACAIAAKDGAALRDISVEKLRSRLKENGAYLG